MGTITKALSLLDHFSTQRPEIRLTEFQQLAERDKATVYRHLSELVDNGFLEQDNQSKGYRLGTAVLRLANVRESSFPARKIILPIVEQLSSELCELVHVNLLQGNALSPLCHADQHQTGLRVSFSEAELLPLHATASGYSVLTFGPESLLKTVVKTKLKKYTQHTLTKANDLTAVCKTTRKRGYSESDGILESGVISYAVPLFNNSQTAFGAMSVAVPASRATATNKNRIIAALTRDAPMASLHLGGSVPQEILDLWQSFFLSTNTI